MHSDMKNVDGYIDSFGGERKEVLKKLRQMILNVAPEAEESMEYKMPTYKIGSDVFAFAFQKHYLSVYINKEKAISAHEDRIGKHNRGKNCIRYIKPEHIDLSGLRALISEAYGM